MRAAQNLCAKFLRAPDLVLDLEGWDLLIRQARKCRLLPRLAALVRAHSDWATVPEQVRLHLESAEAMARRQTKAMQWEIRCIVNALGGTDTPVVLLKGGAYLAAGLPPAQGRLFADIDLLVPIKNIRRVEGALMLNGWSSGHQSSYDQRYYRKWMHEIPPMQHFNRYSVIDLHHAILPVTARIKTDPAPLFQQAVNVPGYTGLSVLAPADMVLHSATHLFHEGDFGHGLRDLTDLDALLRQFSQEPDFWNQLGKRARTLNLARPLYYALRYCRLVLDTPVPTELQQQGKPLTSLFMDWLFGRALAPDHASCDDMFTPIARWILYIRSHWLRMPPHLLIPHLLYKATLAKLQD